MGKEYVTEESFELLEQANADIVVIGDWLNKKEISEKVRYGRACYHATQAVEKMLKGYLRHNGEALVEKIHNLNKLLDNYNVAIQFDALKLAHSHLPLLLFFYNH